MNVSACLFRLFFADKTVKNIKGIEQPDEGQILFDGQDITNIKINERAKHGIGFAFQQPVKFKGITVFDLIKLSAGKQLTIMEACDVLSKVGLSPHTVKMKL